MKYFFPIVLLLLTTQSVLAQSSLEVCNELSPAIEDINQLLPVEVDNITSLVGASSERLSNFCLVTYTYIINAQNFLNNMEKDNGLTLEENISWLKQNESEKIMLNNLKEKNVSQFKAFTNVRGLAIHTVFKFDEIGLPSYKVIVIENES
ncbi:hypothetical protein [Paraglaciecola sp. 25GB23A]|uniref:hypothetical protein n=1 Tax=Paraglaciecola sp. 25GB23A TaxID=3156068 RepID=UPI0032AFFC33